MNNGWPLERGLRSGANFRRARAPGVLAWRSVAHTAGRVLSTRLSLSPFIESIETRRSWSATAPLPQISELIDEQSTRTMCCAVLCCAATVFHCGCRLGRRTADGGRRRRRRPPLSRRHADTTATRHSNLSRGELLSARLGSAPRRSAPRRAQPLHCADERSEAGIATANAITTVTCFVRLLKRCAHVFT